MTRRAMSRENRSALPGERRTAGPPVPVVRLPACGCPRLAAYCAAAGVGLLPWQVSRWHHIMCEGNEQAFRLIRYR
jgi:hypothetical protein